MFEVLLLAVYRDASFFDSDLMLKVKVGRIKKQWPDKGKTLIKPETEKIDEKDWRYVRLIGSLDKCGIDEAKLKNSSWKSLPPFNPPPSLNITEGLSIQTGRSINISLEANIVGITIGPKAAIEFLKEAKYSYKLIGGHKYIAYFPDTSLVITGLLFNPPEAY